MRLDELQLSCGLEQFFPEIGVSYFDECYRAFRDRLAEEIGHAVLGNDIVHFRPGERDAFAGKQPRPDARDLSVIRGRAQANNRLTALRASRSAVKFRHGGDAAIEKTFELIGANLSGKIDGPGLSKRHKPIILRDERGR